MLRNINQPKLCNGTRLSVKKLMTNIIEATILTGPFKGEDVLILEIPMIPTDMSLQFKRLQFPIRLAFAITKHRDNLKNCVAYIYTLIASHMGNYMLPVPESAIHKISLSTRKLEQPRILCIHKYWKIKHIRNMHFLFFPFKQQREAGYS